MNTPLPAPEEIADYIAKSNKAVSKSAIARRFKIKGGARVGLKRLLKQMVKEGVLGGNKHGFHLVDQIPPVTVLDIAELDEDGDLIAYYTPSSELNDGIDPIAILVDQPKKGKTIGVGNRILARIDKSDIEFTGYNYRASPIRLLEKQAKARLGILHFNGHSPEVRSIDKKSRNSWPLARDQKMKAEDGDLVRFEIKKMGRGPMRLAKIIENFGNPSQTKNISLYAIAAYNIPDEFPQSVLVETEDLPRPKLADGREDLRKIPFITIDPSDARDHDDAVFAEFDDDPNNKDGFHIYVAIADVANYVTAGSGLDKEAYKRGNSIYFPDRVVPMLPESLSNDLCSLRELEDRYALVAHMTFDKDGQKIRHNFIRALIKSHGKLAYEEAQSAFDGAFSDKTKDLWQPVLEPLYKAYQKLAEARQKRAPLELDLPERKIIMNEDGGIDKIHIPERLDAHRLIEEMMIMANVSAAEALEKKNSPCLYRIHDRPSGEKLHALATILKGFDIKVSLQAGVKATQFNQILTQSEDTPFSDLLGDMVLRSQSQAEYSGENIGHFGLNLPRYAHFTSPIRRYADLIVHRLLISALNMGDDGAKNLFIGDINDIGEQISLLERRAMTAERETLERLVANHLKDQLKAEFSAKISGVTRVGIFVRLNQTGADGFIPAGSLGEEYYVHNEAQQALVGEKSCKSYQLGQAVTVRLLEVIPEAGAMRFEMISKPVRRKHVKPVRSSFNKDDRRGHRSSRRGPDRGRPPGRHKGKRRRGRRH